MTIIPLEGVFDLMVDGPSRYSSLSASLVVTATEPGALAADRAERQLELQRSPEMIEQPPMRRRFGGDWQYRIYLHDGDVSMSPRQRPTTPAGGPGTSDSGLLELMVAPWRMLGGYQFDDHVEESVVDGRECWILRGKTRLAEPLADHFLEGWARASDSTVIAIDKELGIVISVAAGFGQGAWYRAELHDLGSQPRANDEPPNELDDDELEVDPAEAVRRLRFPLYLPDLIPRDSLLKLRINASGTWAGASFETGDFQWRVLVLERPADAVIDEDLQAWEPLEGGRWDSWIWDQSSDPTLPGRRWLVARTKGTHCSLYSTLPRSLLVEVAGSLESQT